MKDRSDQGGSSLVRGVVKWRCPFSFPLKLAEKDERKREKTHSGRIAWLGAFFGTAWSLRPSSCSARGLRQATGIFRAFQGYGMKPELPFWRPKQFTNSLSQFKRLAYIGSSWPSGQMLCEGPTVEGSANYHNIRDTYIYIYV